MTCRTIYGADGKPMGIGCTRTMGGRAVCDIAGCSRAHTTLCDWKLKGAKAGQTCSARLCASHATNVGPERDLCPAHAAVWDAHPSNPKNQKGAPEV